MSKSEMIDALLDAFIGSAAAHAARGQRLQRLTPAGLKREMLLRGLADFDEPDDEDYLVDDPDHAVPASVLNALPAHALYAE